MRTTWRLCAAAALVAAVAVSPGTAHADDGRFDELDQAVAAQLDATATPGAAMAIVEPDAVVHNKTWGHDGDGKPVTADTSFLWGSVAKPVTALAVARLAETGELDLTEPVNTYLPWFAPSWNGEPAVVTVEQLLTNTSGIGSEADAHVTDRYDNDPHALNRTAKLLSKVELDAEPGTSYDYVSANYLLAGAVISAVTGVEFRDHLQKQVLEPLGMSGAITTASAAETTLTPGHRQVLGVATFEAAVPFDESGISYGYLGGSLNDLSAFARAQLGGGDIDSVISPDALAAGHRDHTGEADGGFGYGWEIDRLPGSDEPIVFKPGAAPGFHAMVLMVPRTGQAVVMLQNSYDEARALQLRNAGYVAANLLIGAPAAEPATADTAMLTYPWLAFGLAAVLLLLAALSLRGRPAGQVAHHRWRIGLWLGIGVAFAVFVAAAVPPMLGVTWLRLWLWATDLSAGFIALAIAVPLLCAARAVRTLRRRRAATGST